MFFTECWITAEHDESEYSLAGFQHYISMKNRGGSCIFTRDHINAYEVFPPNKCEDAVWIVIKTAQNVSRVYGCVYRSPNSSVENNNKLIENILWINYHFTEVVITGDFNLPAVNWNTLTSGDVYSSCFIDTINDCGYEQLVSENTRYREGQNSSLLDLILVSDPDIIENVAVGDAFGKCDHCRIEFCIKNCYEKRSQIIRKYNFRKMNESVFEDIFGGFSWRNLLSGDVGCAYEGFTDIVKQAIRRSTPLMGKFQNNIAPWSSKLIGKLSKRKREKWDRFRYTQSVEDYTAYKSALTVFNAAKENAICNYENRIISNKNTNKKQFHRYVARGRKYAERKFALNSGNGIETDEARCAVILNHYFASVFTHGSSNPEVDTSSIPNVPEMPDIVITDDEVREAMDNLDVSKSSGPDGIPAIVSKKFSSSIAPVLGKIFRMSYDEGVVLGLMKIADIIPLHKSGDKTLPKNFRPVSLTPIIAKLFERLIKKHIEAHVERYLILSEVQHGFRKAHSTATNLVQFTNDLANLANESKSISII